MRERERERERERGAKEISTLLTMSSPRVIMLTLTIVLVVTIAPKAEAARAFIVFGDSLVDSGNNNYLATTARADYPPNGIDYPTRRPTGRFSNGLNLPDIISEFIVLISISLHISFLSLAKFYFMNVFH